MFIAALFTIARTWKQPKCPSIDEWIKKMWYMFTMDYYSAIKTNEIMPFAATWMDMEIVILSEVRGRRINHKLSLPPRTRRGPEAILRFCGQLPKKRVEKWSSGALQFTNLQSFK